MYSINVVEERILEPPRDKTNKMACAPSEDSDQLGHPPSLIRVFAVRMKKPWVLRPKKKKKNTHVSTNMPKILGSVGRKFFLFFVNFLYADFRAKLLLGAHISTKLL